MGIMSAKEAREISSLNSNFKVNAVLGEIKDLISGSTQRGQFDASFVVRSSRLYGATLNFVVSELKSLGYSVVTPPQHHSVCRIDISWEGCND